MSWGSLTPLKMFTQFTHFQFTQMDVVGIWDDVTHLTDITGPQKMYRTSQEHLGTAPTPKCQNDQNIH